MKRNTWIPVLAGILLLLAAGSCKQQGQVLSEKKFINVLVDLHLAESIGIGQKQGVDGSFEIDSASLYGSVFEKYQISKEIFDSTMIYYSRRPEKFQRVYNAVTARLKKMEVELSYRIKEEEKIKNQILWKSDSVYRFPPLSGEKIPVDILLDGPGIYVVTVKVKIMPDDYTLDPRMSVYFYKNDSLSGEATDRFSEIRYIDRNGTDRSYRAVKKMDSTNVYTHLRGYISNYSNTDSLFKRNLTISEITVSKR